MKVPIKYAIIRTCIYSLSSNKKSNTVNTQMYPGQSHFMWTLIGDEQITWNHVSEGVIVIFSVMVMLEKLWKNSTEVKSLLSDVLHLSPVIINQIMTSSINLNQVIKILFLLLLF